MFDEIIKNNPSLEEELLNIKCADEFEDFDEYISHESEVLRSCCKERREDFIKGGQR
jgi:hypothetical protein